MKFTDKIRRDRPGMTLIELLVSTAILSLMLMLFSMVLNSTQKVTSTSHATMRANAAAAGIADAIRKDFARITKNGFLCITQTADGSPVLMFTTSGITASVTSNNVATEAVVMLGLCPNTATANPNDRVLWTKRMLLDPITPDSPGDDIWEDAGFQAVASRVTLNGLITNVGATGIVDIEVPPITILGAPGIDVSTELAAYSRLWQVLAIDCEGLSIMWTDGSDTNADGQMDWYGIIHRFDNTLTPPSVYEVEAQAPLLIWRGRGASQTDFEFNWALPGPAAYRTIWFRRDQNWPSAIKISFVIKDPDMPEQLQNKRYEVICPIK